MNSGNDASGTGDLIAAFFAVAIVSAVLFFAGLRLSRRLPAPVATVLTGVIVVALVAFVYFGRDSLLFVHLLPLSSVLIAADLTLPLVALLAGALAVSLPPRRRVVLQGILLVMAAVYTVRPLLDNPPVLRERPVVKGVVMQSSDASCGAASAATLLRTHGISASEPEMAPLCRTRRDGTEMLGIYRGLSRKTRGTAFFTAALTDANTDTLIRTAHDSGPVLIGVGLPRFALRPIDPRYESEWGWTPGLRHAVVFFGSLPNGKIDIGDPSTGREAWDRKALDVLWDGEGLYLKPR